MRINTPAACCPGVGPNGEPLLNPVAEYQHGDGIAVVGGFVYRGSGVANLAGYYVFGDFASGYTVAERPDLRVLRDPFSAKPHVLFYATKRVGGDVSDFAAIKILKFAAS